MWMALTPRFRIISNPLAGRSIALVFGLLLCAVAEAAGADTAAGVEAYEAGNYERAYEELKPEAEAGNAEAQYYLGSMFARGLYVEKDFVRARAWMLRASDRGHLAAKVSLGYIHDEGLGTPVDDDKAVSLYRSAGEAGEPMGQRNLGLMYEKGEGVERDYQVAAQWFRRAAEQGDDVAAYKLGELFYYGRGELELDYQRAHRWFGEAALAGNADAQYALGGLYLQGLGVPNNNIVSYTWTLFAAEQGHSAAQRSWENAHWFIDEREEELIRARVERREMPTVNGVERE